MSLGLVTYFANGAAWCHQLIQGEWFPVFSVGEEAKACLTCLLLSNLSPQHRNKLKQHSGLQVHGEVTPP